MFLPVGVARSPMRMILVLAASAVALASCGGGDAAQKKGREAPLVTLGAVQSARFVERIDAVGTARANEQVTLTAPVTQRIVRLNFLAPQLTQAILAGTQPASVNAMSLRSAELPIDWDEQHAMFRL